MISPTLRRAGRVLAGRCALLVLAALPAQPASAASVTLCAEPYVQAVPGSGAVPMWGYRQVAQATDCDSNTGVGTASPWLLPPLPPGDTTLTVTLVNRLTVPTSVVVAAQRLPDGGSPVMAADLVGPACVPTPGAAVNAPEHPANCRVRSFTVEAAPGATQAYTFSNLRPGTYLFQSGTHPQTQVQMGLFGLLVVPGGPAYDAEQVVVLSEIDPAMHQRIQDTLGSADPSTWKAGANSTLNYAPRAFLINGKAFQGLDTSGAAATDLPLLLPSNGGTVRLRVANAGLQSRSLLLNRGTWKLMGEDGHDYPAPREQSSVLVPAGKTTDLVLFARPPADASTDRSLALFDRRAGTDNGDGAALGGQVARLALVNNGTLANQPPQVNAGADQSTAGFSASLAGSVTDDGLLLPATQAWSLVAGPGGVSFANAAAAATTATFTAPGSYTLRLSAYDGQHTVSDDVVVTVAPQADLGVTISDGLATIVQGASVNFTIVVSNTGPNAVPGAVPGATLPTSLSGGAWACTASAGSSCAAANGSGALPALTLAVGGSATITLPATVSPTAAVGSVVTTATVTPPPGYVDVNTANNTASDTDTVVPALPALAVLDNFNRANARVIGGSWSQVTLGNNLACLLAGLGSPAPCAAMRVNNNNASDIVVASSVFWNAPAAGFGAKQGAAFNLVGAPVNGTALILKASGGAPGLAANFIRVRINTAAGNVVVETTATAGVAFTTVSTLPGSFVANDRLSAVANADGSVDVWRTSGTVTTYLGRSGVTTFTGAGRLGLNLPVNARVDDYRGGTVTP